MSEAWQIMVSALAAISLIANIFFLWWNNRGKREAALSTTLLNLIKSASALTQEAERARSEAEATKRRIQQDQASIRRWQEPSPF